MDINYTEEGIFLDRFADVTELGEDWASFIIYSGQKAYQACINSDVYDKNDCRVFPNLEEEIFDEEFLRWIFLTEKSHEQAMGFVQAMENGLENWQYFFPRYRAGIYPASNYFKLVFVDTDLGYRARSNNEALYMQWPDYIDDYFLLFHEFVHSTFAFTEFGNICSEKESCVLTEGIANYLAYKAVNNDFQLQQARTSCGENSEIGDDFSYAHYLFETDQPAYGAGECFFWKLEETCSPDAVDQILMEVMERSYKPLVEQESFLSMIKNNCKNDQGFDRLLKNFGFSVH